MELKQGSEVTDEMQQEYEKLTLGLKIAHKNQFELTNFQAPEQDINDVPDVESLDSIVSKADDFF